MRKNNSLKVSLSDGSILWLIWLNGYRIVQIDNDIVLKTKDYKKAKKVWWGILRLRG